MNLVRLIIVLVLCHTVTFCGADPPDSSPRMTPLVKVIKKIEPSVVALFVQVGPNGAFVSGSGSIIHPAGYVLTNNHVLPKTDGFALLGEQPVRFTTVARLPEKDIALVRLLGVTTPLPTIPLGHSHDVMNGESVVVAGNPGGRGIVFTSGIISSASVKINSGNALVMTQFRDSRRDPFLQFDAASNRGNSGGPLVNMEGELIGIVSALIQQEQNVGFAIPVDRVRELFEQTLEPEVIYERSVGVQLNMQADEAIVTEVIDGSTAAKNGLRAGDTISSVGGRPLRHAVDWYLMLHQALPQKKPIQLVARRGAKELPMKLIPEEKRPIDSVEVEDLEPGLSYRLYHGRFKLLPDFDELEPERDGTLEEIDLSEIRGDRDDDFAAVIEGFIKLESDGLYRLTLTSDDGSRLYFHGEPFIDHDGTHPTTAASRLFRAKAGLHPIRIEYFESVGQQSLSLLLQQNGKDKPSKLEFYRE